MTRSWSISKRVAYVVSGPERVVALHLDRPADQPIALLGSAAAIWNALVPDEGEPDAVPEDEQPQVRRLAGERREHHARAVDGAADERHQARAAPVLQPPADRRADEDQPDGELERHRRLDVPQPHRLGRLERAPEETPRIDPADDELNKDTAHEGQPTHEEQVCRRAPAGRPAGSGLRLG